MLKLLLLLCIGFLMYRALRQSTALREKNNTQVQPRQLVACKHCGLRLPAEEAIIKNTQMYCCEAHSHAD
jgi:hypothetical protein